MDDLTLTADQVAAVKAKGGDVTVGILAPLSSEYLANVVDGAKQEAAALGLKTSVVDYQFDAAKGVAGIENLVSQGVKYMVVVLTDPPAMIGAVKAAEAQGVTVVQFAGDQVAKEAGGYSVAINDKDLGTSAGEAAAAIAKGRGAVQIAILDYPSQPNVVIRADAMVAAIKAGAPEAKIVARVTGGTQDAGLTASESLLQKYPDLGGVVSVNDAGGYGAVQAFEGAQKTGANAFVVGCDAESKARSLIAQGGIFKASVDTQPGLTGKAAVEAIGKLIAGGSVAQYTTVPVKTVTS
ncbi:sugar ABC transporter substrate-binding protein [Nakamurella endophytica]|uniref:Sugar ABC transporter substrate-binding protein n=1 Tax=Nakamurella endophytica TaxID=1748367 RepID=A0A917TBV7_9ACTN|nr:sugar ABC transporter substrate-binding protein [Nakamurella endophytica]